MLGLPYSPGVVDVTGFHPTPSYNRGRESPSALGPTRIYSINPFRFGLTSTPSDGRSFGSVSGVGVRPF